MSVCRICGAHVYTENPEAYRLIHVQGMLPLGPVCYDHDLEELIDKLMLVDPEMVGDMHR